MCGLICVPSPRLNRPFDASCRSYERLGERHRAARERDRDRGRELEPFRVLAREQQREERIVRAFEGVDAVVAERFEPRACSGTAWRSVVVSAASIFTGTSRGDLLRWVDGRLRARNLRRARRRRLRRVVHATEHAGGVRLLGRARRRRSRARARDRHRRVAIPLAARGVEVHGIDSSPAMVAQLRAKPGGDDIPVVVGDMADVPVDGTFALVFVVFNTFFMLTSQADRSAASATSPRTSRPVAASCSTRSSPTCRVSSAVRT